MGNPWMDLLEAFRPHLKFWNVVTNWRFWQRAKNYSCALVVEAEIVVLHPHASQIAWSEYHQAKTSEFLENSEVSQRTRIRDCLDAGRTPRHVLVGGET